MLRPTPIAEPSVAIRKLNVIGAGNVAESKIDPAVKALESNGRIDRVTYFDVHRNPPFASQLRRCDYRAIDPERSAYLQLTDCGCLDDSTLTIVACATRWHAHYAADLARFVPVAVEKPLTMDTRLANELLVHDGNLFPIGHQIFKRPMLDFLDACATGRFDVATIASIDYDLMETIGVGNRSVDPIIWDTGFHALEAVKATYRAIGQDCTVTPIDVRQACYVRDHNITQVPTAARIRATLSSPCGTVDLTVRLGKGLREGRKEMRCHDRFGRRLATIDLSESGHLAHQRLLEELIASPQPNMRLTLADAVSVVTACDGLQSSVIDDEPSYPFGSTPEWLA